MVAQRLADSHNRRSFIGGSDARIIMGHDFAALLLLWKTKRGEVEPENLSRNLLVQLGSATEPLNRHWYEQNTGQVVTLYQHLLLTAEKKFWRCVESGEEPKLFGIEPPRPPLAPARVVDMSTSNAWAALAEVYRRTRAAALDHDKAKAEMKLLVPEDAKEASGHGVRAKRSKSGAVSFELLAGA